MTSPYVITQTPLGTEQDAGDVERQLGLLERLWSSGTVRKTVIVLTMAAAWEIYARYLNNPLLFPTLSETLIAAWEAILDGTLPKRALSSVQVLLVGYAVGVLLAAIVSVLAISTRIGSDFL